VSAKQKVNKKTSWLWAILGWPLLIVAGIIVLGIALGLAALIVGILGTIALALLVPILLWLFGIPLTFDRRRTWKALIITGFITLPFFHIAFLMLYNLSKGWAFFSALGTVVVLIPLFWGCLVILSHLLGLLIVSLFAPENYGS